MFIIRLLRDDVNLKLIIVEFDYMNEKKLKILVVTQYFWPENMRINDLVEGFLEKGHELTVLTGLPNYPEGRLYSEYKKNKQAFTDYKGAKIIRAPMFLRGRNSFKLILNYCSFFLSASMIGLFRLRSQPFDAIFVYAVSPIMVAIPAILLGRLKATPVFLWILDLWPESLSAVGRIHNKFILNLFGGLVSWIYNQSDYLLVQSNSFKAHVLNYSTSHIDDERMIYFPSWAEDIIVNQSGAKNYKLLEKDARYVTVMFTGNIGEAQDFIVIVNAFEKLKAHPSIRLVIVGNGRMLPWVKEQIIKRQLNNIILLGKHPVREMPGLFSCADALLVSLKKDDALSKTIPGKLQAYLAAGRPVLGMVDGEAADIISHSGCGFVCPSGDEDGLVENTLKLHELKLEERDTMGGKGVEFYQQHFQSKQLFNKLEDLFRVATLRC